MLLYMNWEILIITNVIYTFSIIIGLLSALLYCSPASDCMYLKLIAVVVFVTLGLAEYRMCMYTVSYSSSWLKELNELLV